MMRYENDLDAAWYSVYVTNPDKDHEVLKERAYSAIDCINQAKFTLEPLGYSVTMVIPMLQHHSGNRQFIEILRDAKK